MQGRCWSSPLSHRSSGGARRCEGPEKNVAKQPRHQAALAKRVLQSRVFFCFGFFGGGDSCPASNTLPAVLQQNEMEFVPSPNRSPSAGIQFFTRFGAVAVNKQRTEKGSPTRSARGAPSSPRSGGHPRAAPPGPAGLGSRCERVEAATGFQGNGRGAKTTPPTPAKTKKIIIIKKKQP